MAVYYKTQGFIFKKKDLFEADRVFSVFSNEFGRLEITARAIRKITSKLRGGIEILSFSEIEFVQGKNRKTLTDTILIEKFSNITKDLSRLEMSNKIIDILNNFIKGQEKDELIFALLKETFNKLNNVTFQNFTIELTYYYFLWNFLSALGYHPEIHHCVACKVKLSPQNLYFSHKEGGIICKNCLHHDVESKSINPDVVKIVRLMLKKDWEILSKLKIDTFSQDVFKKVSDDYYYYILSSHSFKDNVREPAYVL